MLTDPSAVSPSLAFAAGLVSFLSPCVLPLVPSYLAFVTGMAVEERSTPERASVRWGAMRHALLFVVGFGLVFVALGATATAFGVLLGRSVGLVQRVGGGIIVLFGCHLLGARRIPVSMRARRAGVVRGPAGRVGSVVVGIAFGAGWTPCVGPVLASVLLTAGTIGTQRRGSALLAVYALGLGIPFVVVAFGLASLLAHRGIERRLRGVELLTGALLIAVGLMLATGRFSLLSGFLAGFGQLVTLG